MSETKKTPKRFIDRKDSHDIVTAAKNFSYRSYYKIPDWMFYFFFLLLVAFVAMLLYFSNTILKMSGAKIGLLYLIEYLLLSFSAFAGYAVFLIRKLKRTLNAVEFISLSVSKTLENYSNCYCLINQEGKIFYYNYDFAQQYMASNDVEHMKYPELLKADIFDQNAIGKIKDSIENNKANDINLGNAKAKVFPLMRPDGIFALSIIR